MSDPEYVEVPDEIQRDRFGRPMVIPPTGGKPVAYTRCTIFVGALEDTFNLGQWQQRMAVAGIASRPDLHLRAVSLGLPPVEDGTPAKEAEARKWKAAMNAVVDDAREAAAASAAATIGTSLHAITEAVDRGQQIDLNTIPDRYRTHLANYQRATEGFTAVHIEQFLVHDGLQIGGTADRIVRIDGHEGLIVADIKTGSIDYGAGKMAMQLSVYAHSLLYAPATGHRRPVDGIRLDRGVIIHLDAKTGACTLHWVDLAAGWEAVQLAAQVRDWRKRKGLLVPADLTPPAPALDLTPPPSREALSAAVALDVAIEQATCRDDITALWQAAAAQGLWTDGHTEAAKARLSTLAASAA